MIKHTHTPPHYRPSPQQIQEVVLWWRYSRAGLERSGSTCCCLGAGLSRLATDELCRRSGGLLGVSLLSRGGLDNLRRMSWEITSQLRDNSHLVPYLVAGPPLLGYHSYFLPWKEGEGYLMETLVLVLAFYAFAQDNLPSLKSKH